jgi:putative SOS response-associated peptidase YedK
MCGRFALNLNADELEQSARHWVPDVTWRESPPPPEPDEPATPEPGPSRQREHGFRPNNLNVAPSTSYPVIYCPEVSEGSSASKLGKPVLQAMRWGLQPHWLKEKPDYSSAMKTINARDDTILQGGMWKSMRHRHRCVVPVLGFYEWLKKGSDKLPHFTKRTDDQLMCFAGLWDVVHFEDDPEPTYSFTIVTTDSNSQLKFVGVCCASCAGVHVLQSCTIGCRSFYRIKKRSIGGSTSPLASSMRPSPSSWCRFKANCNAIVRHFGGKFWGLTLHPQKYQRRWARSAINLRISSRWATFR